MRVPVVDVRIMRMRVLLRFMHVGVNVRRGGAVAGGVLMLVVLVVLVPVIV